MYLYLPLWTVQSCAIYTHIVDKYKQASKKETKDNTLAPLQPLGQQEAHHTITLRL